MIGDDSPLLPMDHTGTGVQDGFMGWFLSKNKRRGPASRSRQTVKPKPWDSRRTLKNLKRLGGVVGVLGLLAGWQGLERYLSSEVVTRQATWADAVQVTLVDAPAWMNQMVHQDLCHLVADQAGCNPLDQNSLQRAAAFLSKSAWVEQVDHVRRFNRGRIAVVAQYRQPVAVVERPDGDRLVGAGGVLLPGLYMRHQRPELGLPVIAGVATAPQQEGGVWPGSDLQAGLRLLSLLGDQPYLDQIRCVRVDQRDQRGRIHLVLRTDHGMVRWGLPPGMDQVVEPDPVTKKRWLADVYRQRGSIDAGGKMVDIHGAAVFVYPLTADDAQLSQTASTWSW